MSEREKYAGQIKAALTQDEYVASVDLEHLPDGITYDPVKQMLRAVKPGNYTFTMKIGDRDNSKGE
jgi:hypothetical protein